MKNKAEAALSTVRESEKMFLTPADVAPILGCGQQTLRVTARQHPELIGFPFTFIGAWMKIPRVAFLKWLDGDRVVGTYD